MLIDNPSPISKTPTDPALQTLLADLQGNILKAHAKPNVTLLFLQFTAPGGAVKSWIPTLPVTTMLNQLADHKAHKVKRLPSQTLDICTISLSRAGYKYLDLEIDKFNDGSFQSGMNNSTVPKDPPRAEWEPEYREPLHALIILAHDDATALGALTQKITASVVGIANVVASEKGEALDDEKEHFGFFDGRSQPRYFEDDVADDGTQKNWKSFASLNLALVRDPHGKAFTGNHDFPAKGDGTHSYGSYLVFRKLEQDVAGWNNAVSTLASGLHLSPDLVGAFAVGRFKDGTPVTLKDIPSGHSPVNDFTYSGDNGSRCPFHAHIRKANPRGDTTKFPGVTLDEEMRHRITRRGIPYVDKSNKKGLLFMCYQSSIKTQFDFMQNAWVDNDDFLDPGTGIDDVIGQGTSNLKTWPSTHGGAPAAQKFSFGNFVTMKGGEYFFTPSISFLKSLVPAVAVAASAAK